MSSSSSRSFVTRVNHFLQAITVRALFFVIRLFPVGVGSGFGGWVGRSLGPLFPVNKMARRNIKRAFPDKSEAEVEAIIRGMWDNFGRVIFEFPNLDRFQFSGEHAHIETVNRPIVTDARDDGMPGLFVSGHFANWELVIPSIATQDMVLHSIYRGFNNPLLHDLLLRRNAGRSVAIPKGAKGAKLALRLLKDGEHIGILTDQKFNEGIALPFLGRDAMTAPALAQFALRYDCPVILFRVERLQGVKSRITYYPPMKVKNTGDRHADTRAFMLEINQIFEGWIRERPEQWLWLHRRWPEN